MIRLRSSHFLDSGAEPETVAVRRPRQFILGLLLGINSYQPLMEEFPVNQTKQPWSSLSEKTVANMFSLGNARCLETR